MDPTQAKSASWRGLTVICMSNKYFVSSVSGESYRLSKQRRSKARNYSCVLVPPPAEGRSAVC